MSQGFYIASYPNTPFRYEVGEINLRDLMNLDKDIVIHLYVEHVDAKGIVEKIISWFEHAALSTIPGKILLDIPLEQLKSRALLHLAPTSTKSWWLWW